MYANAAKIVFVSHYYGVLPSDLMRKKNKPTKIVILLDIALVSDIVSLQNKHTVRGPEARPEHQ